MLRCAGTRQREEGAGRARGGEGADCDRILPNLKSPSTSNSRESSAISSFSSASCAPAPIFGFRSISSRWVPTSLCRRTQDQRDVRACLILEQSGAGRGQGRGKKSRARPWWRGKASAGGRRAAAHDLRPRVAAAGLDARQPLLLQAGDRIFERPSRQREDAQERILPIAPGFQLTQHLCAARSHGFQPGFQQSTAVSARTVWE